MQLSANSGAPGIDLRSITSSVSSYPVLSPKLLCFIVALEAERNGNDILKPFFKGGFLESTGKVAKSDSRERSSGFGVLSKLVSIMDSCTRRVVLTKSLFAARTALLCRHSSGEDRKCTTRIGTLSSLANAVQYALVSTLALVLSAWVSVGHALTGQSPTHGRS